MLEIMIKWVEIKTDLVPFYFIKVQRNRFVSQTLIF